MMDLTDKRNRRIVEIMLIVVVLGMAALFVKMGSHRLVALNLFYLPVIVTGYFLGRFSAGVLALFSALAVTIATLVGAQGGFAAYDTPIAMALALTLWAAVLGLAAILIGTLCDEREATVRELQSAYVGIAEVLYSYLQGSDPREETATARVARLAQHIAEELKVSVKGIDDIRVAVLLHDLGNVEVTTQVITKAVGSLQSGDRGRRHTFMGTDLVHSLGDVLHGALPLLANQDDEVYDFINQQQHHGPNIPLGVHIIRAARAFDRLTHASSGDASTSPSAAIRMIRSDEGGAAQHVIDALERVVARDQPFGDDTTNGPPRRGAASPPRKQAEPALH